MTAQDAPSFDAGGHLPCVWRQHGLVEAGAMESQSAAGFLGRRRLKVRTRMKIDDQIWNEDRRR